MTELNEERILRIVFSEESESFEFEKVFGVEAKEGYRQWYHQL